MDDEGVCRGVLGLESSTTDNAHAFDAHTVVSSPLRVTDAPTSRTPPPIPAPATETPWC